MTAQQIARLRENFIRERVELLNRRVSAAERKLLDIVISRVVDEFEREDGNIKPTINNTQLVSKIDKVWKDFQSSEYLNVIKQFAGDLSQLQDLNNEYFKIIESDQEEIKKVSKEVNSIMNKRIGINTKGEIVKNGYLDRLIRDETLLSTIKKQTYKAVTTGKPLSEYLKTASALIVGTENKSGGLHL